MLGLDRFSTAKMPWMAEFNGDRLAQARRAQAEKVSQATLGKKIGKSRGMVARYEQGLDVPPPPVIAKIAEVLNVAPSFFENGDKNFIKSSTSAVTMLGEAPALEFMDLPYWGEVPAGDWTQPEGDDALTMPVERSLVKAGRVLVRVAGDSMKDRLQHGDLVHIQLSKTPKDGVITLARNQDNDLNVKVLRHAGGGEWELHPINQESSVVTAPEWSIIGHAVVIERHFGPGRYTREVDELGIRA
jgi:SOS-response transcriptional repressor LexA